MVPQSLRGRDNGTPGGFANATELVAYIFPTPAGSTFRESRGRLGQGAVLHPLIPCFRGDTEFAGAGCAVDEFWHSVAGAQVVLAYCHAARPPANRTFARSPRSHLIGRRRRGARVRMTSTTL